MKKYIMTMGLLFSIVGLITFTSTFSQSEQRKSFEDLKSKYKTELLYEDKSPQTYSNDIPPKHVNVITYKSGTLSLKAWVSERPNDKKRHPAVVFAHGGFSFGKEDWEVIKPYLDAGFIVMTPTFRGENGNPGNFELFYGEVDDLLNAGKYMAKLDYVDTNKIYLAGHSSGGTLALLVALGKSPYAKVASFGASPDQKHFFASGWGKFAPFDIENEKEVSLRSPIEYPECIQKPLYIYVGKKDKAYTEVSSEFVKMASKKDKKVKITLVEGDHFSSLEKSIEASIGVFNNEK